MRKNLPLYLLCWVLAGGVLPASHADSVVVFNEIMYHPLAAEPNLEWVELHNQMAVNVDLSGWSIAGGIRFTFAEGTVIPGGGYLVVALTPNLLAAAGVTNVFGPYAGRLSNAGDKLELRNNNNRLMDKLSYGVEGDWPVGPDGGGVSLAKRDEESASGLPENWTVSAMVGGTPGRRNTPPAAFEVTTGTPLVLTNAWQYNASGVDLGAGWTQPAYDDDAWSSGQALFRAGNATLPLGDPQPIPTVFSSGLDGNRAVLAPGSADPHYLLTLSAEPTASPPPLAATVIQNHPAWAANDADSSWLGPVNPGTANVAAGAYNYRTSFTLDGFDPTTATLTMSLGADNRLNDVLLNGVTKGISYVGFSVLSGNFTISSGFVPGVNTLDFLTANDDGPGPNPAGFRVKLAGLARSGFQARTTLPTGPTCYYFRTQFSLAGAPQLSALKLSAVAADGAVFYLNGAEVLRLNMPAGLIQASTLAVSNVLKPAYLGPFLLPNANLLAGTNLLAVEIHPGPNRTNSVLFGAELALTTTNILIPPPMPVAFNEFSSATNADFWIELINHGATPLDLDGCVLLRQSGATNREYIFPSHILAPGALVPVTKAELGFAADPGDRLFLYDPLRSSVLDAIVAKRQPRGRWPDGTGQWWFPTTLTPGASNSFVFHHDVVINEIMYQAPNPSPAPSTNEVTSAPESWLELYNRGSNTVDLTAWRLSRDIDFSFPSGTLMPPDGYLVVAKDVGSMQSHYPGITIVGPFTNNLHHGSGQLLLLDSAGNPANAVRYFNSQPWPEYPAGGGSSLELRDPQADNSKPEAWAASVESGRSAWSNYTYRAVSKNVLGPTQWKEFVIGLLDPGECLIDDLSVVESPSGAPVQLLQNGNFETGLTAWRALGDHNRSRVEVDPENPTNHVLHLVATGPTEHMHNHLETTLSGGRSVVDGREYQVSFRAKWLAGNNRLNTRLYFNRLAKTTLLPLPSRHGTPGMRNSVFTTNMGPTFANLAHNPVIPKPNAAVTVSVCAADPQGVSNVTLWWSANGGAWKTAPMLPGLASAEPAYTNYAAVLPGQPAGTLVQFYVQAADRVGAISTAPARGANARALFKVDEAKPLMPLLHRFRLLMTPADAAYLHAHTNVMSNDRLGLTVIYDERQVFYNAGIHLQSSERGRDDSSRAGFSVRLPADQLFRGVQNTITIDRSGGYSGLGGKHDEILLWHAVNHAGGIPGFNCDLVQCFAPRAQEDGTGLLRMSAFDADYFDSQYPNGADGNLYLLELIYYPTTTATGNPQAPKLPQPDDVINVEIQDWGNDPENYRWIFLQQNHADQDDYSQIIALNKAFGLSGTALEKQTGQLMDTDEWMRVLAFKAFTGDVDTFTYGLNHNWKIYFRPGDGKALGLLWDMDFSFAQSTSYSSPGTGSPNTYKITKLPNNYRRFYNHLLDISTTTINTAYLAPWAAHYAKLVGQNWSGALNYLQQRANYLRGSMPLTTPFSITSNGGNDFATANDHVALAGTAPLTVKDFEVNGVRLPVIWTSLTGWTLSVPLPAYTNLLVVQGIDNYGHRLTNALDSITITNTGAPALLPVVINEWMADNSNPGGFPDPLDSQFSDWFELYNPNSVAVNLAGYGLTDLLTQPNKWTFPTNATIAPHGFLLLWADNATNLNSADASGDLHVNFQLSKNGDALGLYGPDGSLQHAVQFGAQFQNISQGLFPDGNTNAFYYMTNWTPHAANQLSAPPSPQIISIVLQADGTASLTISAIPGRSYCVEYKDRLDTLAWTPLSSNTLATGPQLTITATLDNLPQRFYRVVLLQ